MCVRGPCCLSTERDERRERDGGSATWTKCWATRRTTDNSRKVGTTHWIACSPLSTHPSLPRVD